MHALRKEVGDSGTEGQPDLAKGMHIMSCVAWVVVKKVRLSDGASGQSLTQHLPSISPPSLRSLEERIRLPERKAQVKKAPGRPKAT